MTLFSDRNSMGLSYRIVVFICSIALCSTLNAEVSTTPAPVSVVVKEAELQKSDQGKQFLGRVRAINTVNIIARVDGFLREQLIEDGSLVKKGDLLFVIESDPYEAELAKQQANVDSAKAAAMLAQLELSRLKEIYAKKAISKSTLDQADASLKQAQAGLAREQAELKLLHLNLEYTRISSPITGKIGIANFAPGALVGPTLGPLIDIVSTDPMRVEFPVPQKQVTEFRKSGRSKEDAFVRLTLADGLPYSLEGKVLFLGVHADSGTDSVQLMAQFDNPDGLLIDNQLVQVSIGAKNAASQLVIPQSALLVDQEGAFVMLVDAANKVVKRRIKSGDQTGSFIVVEQGLQAGDQVIVSGVQKVREGLTVAPIQSEE